MKPLLICCIILAGCVTGTANGYFGLDNDQQLVIVMRSNGEGVWVLELSGSAEFKFAHRSGLGAQLRLSDRSASELSAVLDKIQFPQGNSPYGDPYEIEGYRLELQRVGEDMSKIVVLPEWSSAWWRSVRDRIVGIVMGEVLPHAKVGQKLDTAKWLDMPDSSQYLEPLILASSISSDDIVGRYTYPAPGGKVAIIELDKDGAARQCVSDALFKEIERFEGRWDLRAGHVNFHDLKTWELNLADLYGTQSTGTGVPIEPKIGRFSWLPVEVSGSKGVVGLIGGSYVKAGESGALDLDLRYQLGHGFLQRDSDAIAWLYFGDSDVFWSIERRRNHDGKDNE